MMRRVLLWLGFVPLADVVAALGAAWAEADRAEAELEVEARWSADGCATALDEIGGRVASMVARHA